MSDASGDVGPSPEAPGLPLYRRTQTDLRGRIQSGELAPGARVETEQELMARYRVSRTTVRQALAGLVSGGFVEVRRGLGTYVQGGALEHRLSGFYSYSKEIERHGMAPGTIVTGLDVVEADEYVAAALRMSPASRVVALGRIRLADDTPIVMQTSYLPSARFANLEAVDFRRRGLYETLVRNYGVRPVRAQESFEAVLMTAVETEVLGSRPGKPALRVQRTTVDADGTVIEYCSSTVRTDRYRYSVELGTG